MRGAGVLMSLALLTGACAYDTTSTDGTRTVHVEMRDFAFSPEVLTLRAGEKVKLSFKNVGKLEHEFMAGNEPAVGKGYLKDWLAGALLEPTGEHGMGHAGEGVRVAPNATVTLTILVPAQGGAFEFGCFVSGHYEFGMRGRLVVDVASAPTTAPAGQGAGDRKPAASSTPTHAPMDDDDGEGH